MTVEEALEHPWITGVTEKCDLCLACPDIDQKMCPVIEENQMKGQDKQTDNATQVFLRLADFAMTKKL